MTPDAPARRVLAARATALVAGDLSMVAECDAQLARWGIDPAELSARPVTVTAPAPERRPVRARVRTRAGR